MTPRYLLVVGNRNTDPDNALAHGARSIGLEQRGAWEDARLFTSPATPTTATPDGGVVVGHVFRRDDGDGCRLQVDTHADGHADVRSHLLEGCWGEYVLIQGGRHAKTGLTVTRDPSGGLHCVYSMDHGAGFVTSDISLAVRLGLYRKRINRHALAHFLTYPYLKTERTALDSVVELLPGCSLRMDGVITFAEQVWSPWRFVSKPCRQTRFDTATADLRRVIQRTVSCWAGVDGSILVELSGGLDSSIVAAGLQGTQADVACATLVPDLPGADERVYAKSVSDGLGVPLHAERLGVAAGLFDAPPPESAVGPGAGPLQHAADEIMACVATREGAASFYSGGGGDTVFGYLNTASPAADAFLERGFFAGARAVRDLAELHHCTTWRAGSLAAKKLRPAPAAWFSPVTELINRDAVVDAPDRHPWSDVPAGVYPGDRERVLGLAGTQLFRDGVRRPLRLPLLSQPVMETCLSIPTWMWNTGGVNRSVARAAFASLLPECVLSRQSKGNFLQYNGAVYRQNKKRMLDYLMEGALQSHHLLDREAIVEFFKRPAAPRDRAFMRVFDLCRAESWARHQC